MTAGPPLEPNPSEQQPDAASSNPELYPFPQPAWINPTGWPGSVRRPVELPKRSAVLGIIALVLGVLGVVVPLLPLDVISRYDVRPDLPFPFAIAGLVLGIIGCTGHRRGRAMAIIGLILSVLALIYGTIMVSNSG